MSFKRDGDSKDWLHLQRKQRISDLLAEDIPEEEALILKNGRLTCLICPHRPIFDTVNVLSVHRSGKKHAANVEYLSMDKFEPLPKEEGDSNQKCDIKSKGSFRPTARTAQKELKSLPKHSAPKPKLKPYQRKPTIDLSNSTSTSILRASAGSSSSQTLTAGKYDAGPNRNQVKVKPMFQYQHTQQTSASHAIVPKNNTNTASITWDKTPTYSLSSRSFSNNPSDRTKVSTTVNVSGSSNASEHVSQEKKEYAEKYLQAIKSGWKKDRTGNWVKDEDVEFDSDEEPPDI